MTEYKRTPNSDLLDTNQDNVPISVKLVSYLRPVVWLQGCMDRRTDGHQKPYSENDSDIRRLNDNISIECKFGARFPLISDEIHLCKIYSQDWEMPIVTNGLAFPN